ncbi:hypothetical protein NPX13_g7732 [Xylaria arbuscula]|uniref:Rhodopsin domain-containing protein n=1 Tax=Xylaria arbuscula TaxID=114810 RepID=A0A9W8NA18_9PEZI|nr:hypothetical protein NPX13_g7732 [Xylaria arbuscula]
MPGDTWELFKRYDNSQETPSGFNHRSTVEGIVIPFFVIATVGTAFLLILFDYGFGKHFWLISATDRTGFLKSFYVALLSYTISTILTKLCLLTQYLRLFEDDRRARKICWFFIVVSALWGLAFAIIAIVPCVPLSGFWNWEEKSYCYGFGSKNSDAIGATYAAHVSTNVILDLAVLAIPVPLYFQTFRQKKQRLGFSLILLLGIAVNLISIWRLYTIIKTRAGTYPIADPTFYAPQSIVLAALEVDLASIVASIPVFWPLITHSWGKIFVTQEVHVTRHHRRLTGDDDRMNINDRPFELPHFAPSRHTSHDSDGSLKLVIMDTEGLSSHSTSHHRRDSSSSRAPDRPSPPVMVGGYDRNDPYVRGRVYPARGCLYLVRGAGRVGGSARLREEL